MRKSAGQPGDDGNIARPLPNNVEAERAVLGAIVLDNASLVAAQEKIRPEDFFHRQHRLIFRAMLGLSDKRSAVDAVTLMDELDRRGELADVGGFEYLSQLADGLPKRTSMEFYAGIVREKSARRSLIDFATNIQERAFDGGFETVSAVSDASAFLSELGRTLAPTHAVLKTVNAKELLEMKVEPREFIVEGLLQRRSMNQIFSWRGVGKTWLALTLASSVACGRKFLSWEVKRARPVLFVDGELDAASLQTRLRSLEANTPNLKLLCCDMLDDPFPSLATVRAQQIIESAMGDAQLLILDNLSALAPSSNETEGEDWISIQSWLLSLRRRGVASIFLHHAGHAGWSRGTTRREDLLDIVIELRRPKDYVASEGLRFEMHFTKTRGMLGAGADPIEARLQTDLDGKLIWCARNLEDAREKQIFDLRSAGSSVRDIAEATGIPKSTVSRILQGGK